jgi:hypothetical protein
VFRLIHINLRERKIYQTLFPAGFLLAPYFQSSNQLTGIPQWVWLPLMLVLLLLLIAGIVIQEESGEAIPENLTTHTEHLTEGVTPQSTGEVETEQDSTNRGALEE